MSTHTLPPIWNIPYRRNPFFTGREDTLNSLYRAIQTESAVALTQPQAISGLDGIGKTQNAIEYTYRYHADYKAILWTCADSQSTLASAFVAIAHLLPPYVAKGVATGRDPKLPQSRCMHNSYSLCYISRRDCL